MLSILSTLSLLTLSVPPPPFGSARHPVTQEVRRPSFPRATPAPRGDFLGVAFGFYQTVVTPIDGPRCLHRPTCSL